MPTPDQLRRALGQARRLPRRRDLDLEHAWAERVLALPAPTREAFIECVMTRSKTGHLDMAAATALCDLTSADPGASADRVEAALAEHDPALAARYRERLDSEASPRLPAAGRSP